MAIPASRTTKIRKTETRSHEEDYDTYPGFYQDKHGNLPSRLPPELIERHTARYKMVVERAREKGWAPELGEDE